MYLALMTQMVEMEGIEELSPDEPFLAQPCLYETCWIGMPRLLFSPFFLYLLCANIEFSNMNLLW